MLKKITPEIQEEINKNMKNTLDNLSKGIKKLQKDVSPKELIRFSRDISDYPEENTLKEIKDIISEKEEENSKIENYNRNLIHVVSDIAKSRKQLTQETTLTFIKENLKFTNKEMEKFKNNFTYSHITALSSENPAKSFRIMYNNALQFRKKELLVKNVEVKEESKPNKMLNRVRAIEKKYEFNTDNFDSELSLYDFAKSKKHSAFPYTFDNILRTTHINDNMTLKDIRKKVDVLNKQVVKDYDKEIKERNKAREKEITKRKKYLDEMYEATTREYDLSKEDFFKLVKQLDRQSLKEFLALKDFYPKYMSKVFFKLAETLKSKK